MTKRFVVLIDDVTPDECEVVSQTIAELLDTPRSGWWHRTPLAWLIVDPENRRSGWWCQQLANVTDVARILVLEVTPESWAVSGPLMWKQWLRKNWSPSEPASVEESQNLAGENRVAITTENANTIVIGEIKGHTLDVAGIEREAPEKFAQLVENAHKKILDDVSKKAESFELLKEWRDVWGALVRSHEGQSLSELLLRMPSRTYSKVELDVLQKVFYSFVRQAILEWISQHVAEIESFAGADATSDVATQLVRSLANPLRSS